MEAHYLSQIENSSTSNAFTGPARQYVSGGGLGIMAMRLGRVAIPLIRQYLLPAVKDVGKTLLNAAAPELLDVIQVKTKPKSAIKRATRATIEKS